MVGILKLTGNDACRISKLKGEVDVDGVASIFLAAKFLKPGSQLVYFIIYRRDDREVFSPSGGHGIVPCL